MGNSKPLKSQCLAVLKAAIWGAASSTGLILMLQIGKRFYGSGSAEDFGPRFILEIGILLGIPSVALAQWIGIYINIFIVNGAIAAAIFAMISAVWQFLIKDDYKA